MNYPDYDTLREQYEAGNINAVDFVTLQSKEMTEDYEQFCHDNDIFPQREEAAKSFLDFREALFEACISNQ